MCSELGIKIYFCYQVFQLAFNNLSCCIFELLDSMINGKPDLDAETRMQQIDEDDD